MARKTNVVFSQKFDGEMLIDYYDINDKRYFLRVVKNQKTGDVFYEMSNANEHESLVLFVTVQRNKDPFSFFKPNLDDAKKFDYFLVVDGSIGIHKSGMIKDEANRRTALLCILDRIYRDVAQFDKDIPLYWKINDEDNNSRSCCDHFQYFTQDEIAPLGKKIKFLHVNQQNYDFVVFDKKKVCNEYRNTCVYDEPQMQ